MKTFIERLSDQYRDACGERLVVTSLTRPITRQPPNASAISVHPTGMAVDLRRSDSSGCRQWLETVLLDLEGKGVLEATREQYPPHYHVAVFPNPYLQYVASGEALPEIQVARSTHETASRSRIVRASSRRRIRRPPGRPPSPPSPRPEPSPQRPPAQEGGGPHRPRGQPAALVRATVVVARAKSSVSRHTRTATVHARRR